MEPRPGRTTSLRIMGMFLALCAALLVCSAGWASTDVSVEARAIAGSARAEISPLLAQVALGSEVRFVVTIAGEPIEPANWLVNGVPGGHKTLGTIGGGVYRSPAVAPVPNELHVEAELAEGGRSLFSTVIVGRHDPAYKLVNRWEVGDRAEGQLAETHGICLDRDGNVIVTDPTLGLVYRYTRDGEFLDEIGFGKGTGPEFFDGPRDAKVDAKGRIYVAEGNHNRIQRFDPDGTVVVSDGKAGLKRPHALDLDAQGRIYVADVDNARVAVFDEDCRFLTAWPTPVIGPERQVAPHGVGVDPNGDVFVVDFNGLCCKFTGSGELLFTLPLIDRAYHAMCTDRWGNVYFAVRNTITERSYIDKFNNNGVHVVSIDVSREGKAHPVCIAADGAGILYVADEKGVDVLVPTSTEAMLGDVVFPEK